MAIRVGQWDCPFCGHKGNLGPEKQCAACRKPRGDDVQFYLPDDAEVVTDEATIVKAKAGPDWTCDYCGADNPSDQVKCRACANPRTQTDEARQTQSYDLKDTPTTGATVSTQDKQMPQGTAGSVPKKLGKKGCGCLTIIGAIFIFLLIIGIIGSRPFAVTITGHEWSRQIDLVHYSSTRQEGWELPPNGQLVRSFRAIHHYDQVFDHYEMRTRTEQVKVGEERYISGKKDLGNGYFEDEYSTRPIYEEREVPYQEKIYRDEPVYQKKYVYNIYRWVDAGVKTVNGQGLNPQWPVWTPPSKEWKEKARIERYTIVVKDKKGKVYRIQTDFKDWQRLKDGVKTRAKISGKKGTQWEIVESKGQ